MLHLDDAEPFHAEISKNTFCCFGASRGLTISMNGHDRALRINESAQTFGDGRVDASFPLPGVTPVWSNRVVQNYNAVSNSASAYRSTLRLFYT